MPFTVADLRYHAEQSYPVLYAYLQRHAQRALGSLKYDAFELDSVVGHIVEQLVRMGILGGGNSTPLTALDRLSDAQFYAFLNRSIQNKAIDRLRKRRLTMSTVAELEAPDGMEGDGDPLNDAVAPAWGDAPFATPEEITLALARRTELRDLLIHCIQSLRAAPHQLHAVLKEMEDVGADELLHNVIDELKVSLPLSEPIPHISQHKDHAHKKLRHCLQGKSSNLTVIVALRLTEYGTLPTNSEMFTVSISTLAQSDLSERDVRAGLKELVAEGSLHWHGEEVVRLSTEQMKHLAHFYREE